MKKLRLIITDEAKADLRAIHRYIAQDNPNAAKALIKALTEKLKKLADTGVTGSPRDWVSTGLRAFPYKERCFYFRIIDNKMIVVRILHGKQDITAQELY